jgi:hypothetical protein
MGSFVLEIQNSTKYIIYIDTYVTVSIIQYLVTRAIFLSPQAIVPCLRNCYHYLEILSYTTQCSEKKLALDLNFEATIIIFVTLKKVS